MRRFFLFLYFFLFLSCTQLPNVYAEDVFVFQFSLTKDILNTANISVLKLDNPNFSTIDFSKNNTNVGDTLVELFDADNTKIYSHNFSISKDNTKLEIPYFSIAKRYDIKSNKTNKIIASGSLQQFSQCNSNAICEIEQGENMYTCVFDCSSVINKYSTESQKILEANNGIIKNTSGEVILNDARFSQRKEDASTILLKQRKNNFFSLLLLIIPLVVIGGSILYAVKIKKSH